MQRRIVGRLDLSAVLHIGHAKVTFRPAFVVNEINFV